MQVRSCIALLALLFAGPANALAFACARYTLKLVLIAIPSTLGNETRVAAEANGTAPCLAKSKTSPSGPVLPDGSGLRRRRPGLCRLSRSCRSRSVSAMP